MYLTKAMIKSADCLPIEDCPVPEWGGTVRVRTLKLRERTALELAALEKKGKNVQLNRALLEALIVAACMVDAGGDQLFTEKDVAELQDLNGAAVTRVFNCATKLNAWSGADVEELAKNSDSGPSAASPSS